MDWEIVIKGDTNDADYVVATNTISNDDLERFKPLIEAIKNFQPYKGKSPDGSFESTHHHNWPCGEYSPRTDLGEKFPHEIYSQLPKELIEEFSDTYIPYSCGGIHTIESIFIYPVPEKIQLL